MHGVVAFDHKYKGVIFQDVGGDICDEDVNAIGIYKNLCITG